jgi:hypothetical protein
LSYGLKEPQGEQSSFFFFSFKDQPQLSEILYLYIIMLLKQFSNIEDYVKYVLQIFVHITCICNH